jgi:hypothetical protein
LIMSKQQSLAWEADDSSYALEASRLSWDPKVHYCIHKSSLLDPVLIQHHSTNTCKTHLNILFCSLGLDLRSGPLFYSIFSFLEWDEWARGSVAGWGTMLQAGRSRVRIPMKWIFQLPNSSSCAMALGSTQPLMDINTRNLPGG